MLSSASRLASLPVLVVALGTAACARDSYDVQVVSRGAPAPASPSVPSEPQARAADVRHAPDDPAHDSDPPLPADSRSLLSAQAFARVLRDVESLDFPSDRLDAIRRVAGRHRVTTAQAIALAATLPFSSMRVDALTALYPVVADPGAFDDAYAVLDFPGDRRALRARLAALAMRRPRSG